MSRLGYNIPNYTYGTTSSAELIALVIAQAREADAAGFDRLTVMDHFFQLPQLGRHDEPMIECYTLLAALAQQTEQVRLSGLVTGNTYRNPAMLAKQLTALDLVSNGRATLGIGAGWFELEHDAMGFEFGTFTDRFERLEEALQIIMPLLRGDTVTFDGDHYQVRDMVNSPAPISRIPLMIGGTGERKTLRMAAQYADESNFVGLATPGQVTHKLGVLHDHCDRLGRDRSDVAVTVSVNCCIAPTAAQADADLRAMAAIKGWPDEVVEMARSVMIVGDPDTVGERLSSFVDTGIDGLAISLPANGHVPERVALLGETATKVLDR